MRLRELIRRIDSARRAVNREIAVNESQSLVGGGLAGEGYAGGFLQALDDIDLLSRDVEPNNRRGYWNASDGGKE